jgi:hypothetical protein
MADMNPGQDNRPPQQEGISNRAVIIFVVIAAIILFGVFFTWYQNTK